MRFLGHRQVRGSWEAPTKKALAIPRFRAPHSAHRRLSVGAVAGWQWWRPAVFPLLFLLVNPACRLLASPTQRLQRRRQRKKYCLERAYFHS